jgi:hypothetical protein
VVRGGRTVRERPARFKTGSDGTAATGAFWVTAQGKVCNHHDTGCTMKVYDTGCFLVGWI